MKRRDFVKYGVGGLATLVVGSKMPWLMDNPAYAAVQTKTLYFTITDAVKDMVTHEPGNNIAQCYFWIYVATDSAGLVPVFPPDCPGPQIYTTVGDTINISIHNDLDENHAFFIPGIYNSGPIARGATVTGTFRPTRAGAHMYYDNLNTPVNRVMGLHGAFIVMPANLQGTRAQGASRLTPYDRPTPNVQKLFDDFGRAPWWPGLAWEQGDPAANPPTPPFRQYVWLVHQASPVLFDEVGNYAPGLDYPAAAFMDGFIGTNADLGPGNIPAIATNNSLLMTLTVPPIPIQPLFNKKPHYFTINGQSGHFSHNHPAITPMLRVGEPCVVHVMNPGLWTHSMHMHCNHFFITCVNGRVQTNPIWVDTFTSKPLDIYDMVIPYMRPPDVPNVLGIGRADISPPMTTLNGHPTWPPIEEFEVFQPNIGTTKQSFLNPLATVDIAQRQSPLVYPMHDHSEPSQTAQGGNYNCGLIAGMNVIGDRNTPGFREFPRDADWDLMLTLGNGAPVDKPGGGNNPP